MTDTKQPKETFFNTAEYFNRLHGHQEKENPKEESRPRKPWYQRQAGPPIERNKDTELSVWNKYIKPIIKKHRLFWKGELIEYQFFPDPETIDAEGMYLIQSKMMKRCWKIGFPEEGIREDEKEDEKDLNAPFKGPDDFYIHVIDPLIQKNYGETEFENIKGIKQDLGRIFRLFLIEILEDKKKPHLPYFLEYIRRETKDVKSTKTKQKKLRPNQEAKFEKYDLKLLKDITVCHDKDKNKIKIRMPRENFRKYDYGLDLNFSVVKNKRKELDTFIEIISQPPFVFYAGKKNVEPHFYDANLKLLSRINKKLLLFFNVNLELNLPETYKLYEKCVDEKPGTYRFIFKIINQINKDPNKIKLEKLEKDSLIKKFKEFCSQARLEINNTKHHDKISAAALILLERKWMSKDDINEEIKG